MRGSTVTHTTSAMLEMKTAPGPPSPAPAPAQYLLIQPPPSIITPFTSLSPESIPSHPLTEFLSRFYGLPGPQEVPVANQPVVASRQQAALYVRVPAESVALLRVALASVLRSAPCFYGSSFGFSDSVC